MREQQLQKSINFGEKDYKILREIKITKDPDGEMQVQPKMVGKITYLREIAPLLVAKNKNKKLLEKIDKHYNELYRFLKEENEERVIGTKHKYVIHTKILKVSKSFLSYLLQAEQKLREQLTTSEEIESKELLITNTEELRRKGILGTKSMWGNHGVVEEGTHHIEIIPDYAQNHNFKKQEYKPERIIATIIGKKVLIKGDEYYLKEIGEKPRQIPLYKTETKTECDYEELVELAKEFFQGVNTAGNETEWEEYIESEAMKMTKYMLNPDEELKKLQEEYNG